MRTILLIMIGLSSLSMAQEVPRFTKANGVVTDSKTTLEWQDDYSDNGNNIKSATWTDAIDYCESLSLNGQSDWRLPNKNELLSIVDYGTFNPAISSVFEMTPTSNQSWLSYYWSSTAYARDPYRAWYVGFYYGKTSYHFHSYPYPNVRCVRAGQ